MFNNFAKVEPNPLSLIISKDSQNKIPYNITIQNLTDKYLIFGLLINTKGILLAKPAISYILPNQNISVEINIIKNNLSLDEYKKTKIVVIIIQYNEEIKSVEQAKNLFQILKRKEIDKQEIFIDLNFTQEEIIDTDIVNNNTNITNDGNDNNNEEKILFSNYTNIRSQLMAKKEEILKNLQINRKKLENLMEQKGVIIEKTKKKIKKKYNFDNLIMISIILFGLIMGSNFAILYNKLFHK
jgi:hypothetical protein